MLIRAWSGAQYCGVVLDYQSNLKQGMTVKYKSEFPNEYNRIKRKLGVSKSLKYFRSNGGGENISKKFEELLVRDGTFHERLAPDWQNQNGQSESAIYYVSIRSNAMERLANTPAGLWDECWHYSCLTKLSQPGSGKTAYKAYYGRVFDVKKLVPWGCYAVQHLKKNQHDQGKNAAAAKP
eukprot:3557302-Rhodomonas_salina.2